MKGTLFAVGVLSLGLAGVAGAQSAASSAGDGSHYTPAKLKKMAAEARTPEQYGVLAGAYAQRQASYLQQAAEERREWIRRGQNVVSMAAKYPRPVDSARYLYEYYSYEATEAGQRAAKYGQMAAPAPADGVK